MKARARDKANAYKVVRIKENGKLDSYCHEKAKHPDEKYMKAISDFRRMPYATKKG